MRERGAFDVAPRSPAVSLAVRYGRTMTLHCRVRVRSVSKVCGKSSSDTVSVIIARGGTLAPSSASSAAWYSAMLKNADVMNRTSFCTAENGTKLSGEVHSPSITMLPRGRTCESA